MTHFRHNAVYKVFVLVGFLSYASGDLRDYFNLQHRRTHLPKVKFGVSDYDENVDNGQQVEDTEWNRQALMREESAGTVPDLSKTPTNFSSNFDPNIKWDKNWTSTASLGQLSAVDVDPNGNIAIFCRRSRAWGQGTFTNDNKFDRTNGPIPENVVILLNKQGKKILEWGKSTFYLPHGLTIDTDGNYWMTDVAMHMVLKFDATEIDKNIGKLKNPAYSEKLPITASNNGEDLFENSILKPSLALGVPFEPGNDEQRFCKPTAVAVMKNGDFFVSDGYCNSRVIKFNSKGERIMQFGRAWPPGNHLQPSPYTMLVPHALALAEDLGYLYVADRENGRILCFHSENATYHREYKHPVIGTKVYSIAYAQQRIYLVNGRDLFGNYFHIRGFSIDVNSGELVSQFGPGEDMQAPHDIAVNNDASEIYVVELNAHTTYRFLQVGGAKSKTDTPANSTEKVASRHKFVPLSSNALDDGSKNVSRVTIVLVVIISAMIVIGLCVAVAALVARCQKRGCLLSVRRKSYWEADRKDNFKLSSLLDSRQGKNFRIFEKRPNTRDFSKLNTEPETSEDERGEDSLII